MDILNGRDYNVEEYLDKIFEETNLVDKYSTKTFLKNILSV